KGGQCAGEDRSGEAGANEVAGQRAVEIVVVRAAEIGASCVQRDVWREAVVDVGRNALAVLPSGKHIERGRVEGPSAAAAIPGDLAGALAGRVGGGDGSADHHDLAVIGRVVVVESAGIV